MKDQEPGIRPRQPEMQGTDNVSMSAAGSLTDPVEASLPPNLKSLLVEIRQHPPQGPVVHNGERGLGSNW